MEPEAASTEISDPNDHPTLRERQVDVNLAPIYKLNDAGSRFERTMTGSNRLPLDMFSDTKMDFNVERVETVSDNNMILSGHIAGFPDSAATMVMKDGVLVGNIAVGGRRFEVRSKRDGSHRVRELDPNSDDVCDADRMPVEADESAEGGEPSAGSGIRTMAVGSVHTVDMLVAYTPSALQAAGSVAAIEALIQMGVTDTDLAFRDSGVPHRARLVRILRLSQAESGNWSNDLTALRSTNDGKWDEVHAARTQSGADQVSLVISVGGSTAGIGYIGPSKTSMFTISKTSAFSQYTFSHELGHNLSLRHEDGLESTAGKFRTIMAYGTQRRTRRFSNPNLTFNGVATGSATQNSVAKLLKTIPVAGAYLAAVTPEPGAHGTTPSPIPSPMPAPAPAPAPAPMPAPSPVSMGFVLINANNQETPLSNNGTLTYSSNQAFAVALKANTSSVRFSVRISRSGFTSTSGFTDISAPFIALNNSTARPGVCTITATTASGQTTSINFNLVGQ